MEAREKEEAVERKRRKSLNEEESKYDSSLFNKFSRAKKLAGKVGMLRRPITNSKSLGGSSKKLYPSAASNLDQEKTPGKKKPVPGKKVQAPSKLEGRPDATKLRKNSILIPGENITNTKPTSGRPLGEIKPGKLRRNTLLTPKDNLR